MSKFFVIKNAAGMFHSDNEILGSRKVDERDGDGNSHTHVRAHVAPVFRAAHPNDACKYGDRASAEGHLTHPDLKDPKAFDGCTVVEVET